MQITRNIIQFFKGNTMFSNTIPARGLKNFSPCKPQKDIEYPERRRFQMIPKTPIYSGQVHTFKMQKRLKLLRGPEEIHNKLQYKQYGVMALQGGRMLYQHFDHIRLIIFRQRFKHNIFYLFRVDPPWQPISKKSEGKRMGGGKGSVHHYATPVKSGRIIMEIGGDCEYFEVERALKAVAHALPFKARAVSQEILDEMAKKEEELEKTNKNPYTWKYIIQNNMGDCHKWIRPTDKAWFNKYV